MYNVPLQLLRLALGILKREKWVLLPNDKEPVFSLLPRTDFDTLLCNTFGRRQYQETSCYEAEVRNLGPTYCRLTKRVGELEGDAGIARQLQKSLLSGCVSSKLALTVKSHKGPGEVTTRNIHAFSSYSFAGLSSWVALQFRQWLRGLKHVLMSTRDFHKEIAGVEARPDDLWIGLDIRDFHSQLFI